MFTNNQLRLAIQNMNLLIEQIHCSALQFTVEKGKISKNRFFKSKLKTNLEAYLQELIDELAQAAVDDNPLQTTLFISLQYFFHLEPNNIIKDLSLDFSSCHYLARNQLNLNKLQHTNPHNQFKKEIREKKLPEIQYDLKTGHYTAPDDHKAHKHGEEAKHIFFATQSERFKALLNFLFAKLGIHIFETARYKERDYLESDIYTHDTAIQAVPHSETQVATHYWVGHASNLITIPTDDSPLHVITDPVEGDLAPLLYPRMTKEGNLIDGVDENRLPKIDVVVISHNHRDHVSEATLKRLVKQQPKMIVPEGDEAFFIGLGFTHVVGIKWWEQATINNAQGKELLRVTAVPARHWSGRGLGDAHCSAFNGYVLSSVKLEGDVYFAGDTALMEDRISQSILDRFNIVTSLQPGGPDEGRKDMESTHQSSADAILMHFKILAARYQKLQQAKEDKRKPTLEEFLYDIQKLKTIYNHTATFKLGNLRLKDSFYSYQRLIAAFQEGPQWCVEHLPEHEQKVVSGIRELVKTMKFDDHVLTDAQIANEILQGVVIPKIGQRQSLYFTGTRNENKIFYHRDLISNGRALEEFDSLLQHHIATFTDKFSPNQFVCGLLENYQHPWHAFFSRTYKGIRPYGAEIRNCQNNEDLLQVLNRMESSMGTRNQHGHMQSLIHYAKWVISFTNQHSDNSQQEFKDYFACQQIRKLVDQESQNTGKLLGSDRTAKQKAFQVLSDQLADVPEELDEYQTTIKRWLDTRIEGTQSVNEMLVANRSHLFTRSKTRSEEVLEKINEYTGVNRA